MTSEPPRSKADPPATTAAGYLLPPTAEAAMRQERAITPNQRVHPDQIRPRAWRDDAEFEQVLAEWREDFRAPAVWHRFVLEWPTGAVFVDQWTLADNEISKDVTLVPDKQVIHLDECEPGPTKDWQQTTHRDAVAAGGTLCEATRYMAGELLPDETVWLERVDAADSETGDACIGRMSAEFAEALMRPDYRAAVGVLAALHADAPDVAALLFKALVNPVTVEGQQQLDYRPTDAAFTRIPDGAQIGTEPEDRRWFRCRHSGQLFVGGLLSEQPVSAEAAAAHAHMAACDCPK